MSAVVHCPCGWEGAVDDALAGQTVRCLACGAPLTVPEVSKPAKPIEAPVVSEPLAEASNPEPVSVPESPVEPGRSSAAPKFDAAAFVDPLRRALRPAWEYVRDAFAFYRSHRAELRRGARIWITEYLPALDPPEDIRREIRVPLAEEGRLRNVDGVWHIALPARCVACGGSAQGDWIEEPRSVLDPFGLLAAPLAAVFVSPFLGWWYQSLLWLVIAPLAGLLGGYALRRTEQFVLRFKRCQRHAEEMHGPELAVFHRRMVLRLGSRETKLAYLRQGSERPDPGEIVPRMTQTAYRLPKRSPWPNSSKPMEQSFLKIREIGWPPADDGYDLEKGNPDPESSDPRDTTI